MAGQSSRARQTAAAVPLTPATAAAAAPAASAATGPVPAAGASAGKRKQPLLHWRDDWLRKTGGGILKYFRRSAENPRGSDPCTCGLEAAPAGACCTCGRHSGEEGSADADGAPDPEDVEQQHAAPFLDECGFPGPTQMWALSPTQPRSTSMDLDAAGIPAAISGVASAVSATLAWPPGAEGRGPASPQCAAPSLSPTLTWPQKSRSFGRTPASAPEASRSRSRSRSSSPFPGPTQMWRDRRISRSMTPRHAPPSKVVDGARERSISPTMSYHPPSRVQVAEGERGPSISPTLSFNLPSREPSVEHARIP